MLDSLIKHQENALRLMPDDLNLRNELGLAYMAKKNYGSAINAFRFILGKIETGGDPIFHSIILNNLGHALRGDGKTVEAVKVLREALELNPNNIAARRKLAVITAAEDPDKAQESLRELDLLITIEPNNAKLYFTKAKIFLARKQYEEIKPLLEKCMELDPHNVQYVTDLASVHTYLGRRIEAAKLYWKAIWMSEGAKEKAYNFLELLVALIPFINPGPEKR
jgi:tetratricopeptide (TPR) repeat protein